MFKTGDKVKAPTGHIATVVGSTETIHIRWDGSEDITGNWPATLFTLVERKFKVGQFVRIVSDDEYNGNVGLIFEDDNEDEEKQPYNVFVYDEHDNEEWFSASEMIPWVPQVGERVIDPDDEDEAGRVLSVDGETTRVLWDQYPAAQNWPTAELEPADEENEFAVGDIVEYTNPFFTHTEKAEVTAIEGSIIRVKFVRPGFSDGPYPADFFSKAA